MIFGMNELELIKRLTKDLASRDDVEVGPGDDCAVVAGGATGKSLLFKTDSVVEGVHFTAGEDPKRVGHKALGRCLSDVAAMGGTPSFALVTLALPKEFEATYVDGLYEGMNALARKHGVAVVGGEVTTNPERLLITVSLLGEVPAGKAVLRSGARAGDAIFVSGELGGSLSGKHLDFEPRLAEAAWLVENFAITSMIDLSDGLSSDLRHILDASKVGAELLKSAIPISRAAKLAYREGDRDRSPLEAALRDGEDYELVFTVAARDAVALSDGWKRRFPETRLGCVGKISTSGGLVIRGREGIQPLEDRGYVHFEES